MANRIDSKFRELLDKKKKAFIAFLTAGDPDMKTTEELILAFENSGVDIIELGVPFSDPLADGPTIQASYERALKGHVDLNRIFDLVGRVRKRTEVPIALMSSYNPVFHFGEERFCAAAVQSGVDGVLIPDLPPEEAKDLIRFAKVKNLSTVFFLSPTTTSERTKRIIHASTGFIYYVSLTGVTGARREIPSAFVDHVRSAKRLTNKPVCVGFGIDTPRQVKAVGRIADGVIVGSAIVNEIFKNKGNKDLVANVARFVAGLTESLE